MKIICCDICDDVRKLNYDIKTCTCGNIGGYYLKDGRNAEIHLRDEDSFKTSRVIGVPNGVRYGKIREGNCWVFFWYDPYLYIFCDGVKQNIINKEMNNEEY